MPVLGCSYTSGLWATALVIFLVVPVQHYVPDLFKLKEDVTIDPVLTRANPSSTDYFHWISLDNLPFLDWCLMISLLLVAIFTYLCDWIQRKVMERRVIKLSQYLSASVERLRALDARQEQLETTLRMVQNATSEYNLLLYLLLRHQHKLEQHKASHLL